MVPPVLPAAIVCRDVRSSASLVPSFYLSLFGVVGVQRERLQSPSPYHRLHRQQQSGRWELTTGTQDGFKPWPACFCSTTGPICVDSVFTRVRSSSELKVIAMRAAFGRRFNAKQFCGAKSTQKHYLMEAVCHARSKQGMSGGNGAGGSA